MPRYYALFKLYDPKYPEGTISRNSEPALVFGTSGQLSRLQRRGNFGELIRFISREEALSRLLTSSRHELRVICPVICKQKGKE